MRLLLVMAAVALVAACSSAPAATPAPSAVTFHSGDNTLSDWVGGNYAVTWDAGGCTDWQSWVAPTTAGAANIPIPVTDGKGSATISVPAGRAYVNSTASCLPSANWSLTILRQ